MARHSLGEKESRGDSRVIKCRISEADEQAARAVVRDGESLSELIRLALAKEVARRSKAAGRSR